MQNDLQQKIVQLLKEQTPYATATIVKAEGSTPRHIGSKMLVTQTEIFGTIGGGTLEETVKKDARRIIKSGHPQTFSYSLDQENAGIQICGGSVEVYIEPVCAPADCFLFGAGHIGAEIVPLLEKLNFRITLIDERADRLKLSAFSNVHRQICALPDTALPQLEFHDQTHILIFTHAHIHDEKIVELCLNKPFKYLGLIGSRKKWEIFKQNFISKGFSEEQIKRVTTPIGLDIGAETPFEIAIAIAAEIVAINSTPKGFGKLKEYQLK